MTARRRGRATVLEDAPAARVSALVKRARGVVHPCAVAAVLFDVELNDVEWVEPSRRWERC